EARKCREMRRNGIDPIEHHKAEHLAQKLAEARNMTFGRCAEDYIAWKSNDWVPSTTEQYKRMIRLYLPSSKGDDRRGPRDEASRRAVCGKSARPGSAPPGTMPFADLPVNVIGVPEVKSVLEPLYKTKPSTGEKVRGLIHGILDYATANEFRT